MMCNSNLMLRDDYYFFKPVKRNQSNGQIIHYHVNLLDLNSEVSIPSSIGNVTNQEFSIDINHAYKVQISAATRVGISEHAASVFIPEQSQGTVRAVVNSHLGSMKPSYCKLKITFLTHTFVYQVKGIDSVIITSTCID